MSPPKFIFGGGGLTEAWRENNISELIKALQQSGINRIESAAVYPYNAPGGADRLLGSSKLPDKGFAIDTKVLYFGDGSGTMRAEAIQISLSGRLKGLGVQKTPVAGQAAAMDAEYHKGSFAQLGVSNISVEMLEEWLQIADEKGFVKPPVYQGAVQSAMPFVAFSPLAGGFLAGKLTFSKEPEDLKGTRFEVSDTNFGGMRYRSSYDKPAMHEALQKAAPVCTARGVSLAEAALRWLLYHSHLKGDRGDCAIIGPSKISQLDSCMKAKSAGPLPEDLAKELAALWSDQVKEAATPIIEY